MFESIVEDTFSLEKVQEYDISIQLSLDGFSFCIYSTGEQKVVAHKITSLNLSNTELIAYHLKEWLETEELLKHTFRSNKVIHFSEHFTLAPNALADGLNASVVSAEMFEGSDDFSVQERQIKELDSRIYFSFPNGARKILDDFLKQYEIIHPLELLFENIKNETDQNRLIVFYGKSRVYVVLAHNQKLLSANNFPISHTNDLVYYTLNTLKQFGLSGAETELVLLESLKRDESIENALLPYFNTSARINPAFGSDNSGSLDQSIHYYFL